MPAEIYIRSYVLCFKRVQLGYVNGVPADPGSSPTYILVAPLQERQMQKYLYPCRIFS
jgi:hypothetical protein